MSTATAAPVEDAPPAPKGKKKLFILVGAAVLALALVGGGAALYLKSRAAAAADTEADADTPGAPTHEVKAHKRDPKVVPTFVPLDPFTVNLADRDAERYAQVGVSLELADPHLADQIKAYMPVIRNNILMVLAHKSSAELLERDGKTRLAREIQRETAKALGFEVGAEVGADAGATAASKEKTPTDLPVAAVHFSNFIIQ